MSLISFVRLPRVKKCSERKLEVGDCVTTVHHREARAIEREREIDKTHRILQCSGTDLFLCLSQTVSERLQ